MNFICIKNTLIIILLFQLTMQAKAQYQTSTSDPGADYFFNPVFDGDYPDLSTGVKRYHEVVLLDKSGTYEEHMNLLPIAADEIQRNPLLTQTPGW